MPTRRKLLAAAAALGAAGMPARMVFGQGAMPTREIPSTGERLPVIGLGSSKVVSEVATEGSEPVAAVLQTLVEEGGRVVDTWPRNAENDTAFGAVINSPGLAGRLFVTTKIDRTGRDAGIAQFEATRQQYGLDVLDLTQIFSLTDLDTHWPSLKAWKDDGLTRYIGVTVSEDRLYDRLESFMQSETPDFVQLNYSITERASEERLIPLAADLGIAIIINRPFMNGTYFDRLEGRPLPAWTEEFGCSTWAEFSLKYILANPLPTCVLTETTNTRHMRENARAAMGPMPDAAARQRMREFIQTV